MKYSNFWLAAAIIAIAIVIGFIISAPHAVAPTHEQTATATSTPAVPTVAVSDAYRHGVHTLTGSLLASDPCTSIAATSTLEGTASTSQSILIALSMPEDTGVCLQEPATTTFSTTLTAPSDLPIRVTVNGTTAATTTP